MRRRLSTAMGTATFWAEELDACSKTKFNGVGEYECLIADQRAVIKIYKATEKQLSLSKEAVKTGWKISGGNYVPPKDYFDHPVHKSIKDYMIGPQFFGETWVEDDYIPPTPPKYTSEFEIPEDLIKEYGKDNIIIGPPVISLETTEAVRYVMVKNAEGKVVKIKRYFTDRDIKSMERNWV